MWNRTFVHMCCLAAAGSNFRMSSLNQLLINLALRRLLLLLSLLLLLLLLLLLAAAAAVAAASAATSTAAAGATAAPLLLPLLQRLQHMHAAGCCRMKLPIMAVSLTPMAYKS